MDEAYNDIGQWKFKDLVDVFGADPTRSKTFQVKTKQEAEDLFNNKDFCSAAYLQVCEVKQKSIPERVADELSLWSCTCPKKTLQEL